MLRQEQTGSSSKQFVKEEHIGEGGDSEKEVGPGIQWQSGKPGQFFGGHPERVWPGKAVMGQKSSRVWLYLC